MSTEPPPVQVLTTQDLARRAGRLAAPGTRTILGIAGAPGAGKSTLAEALVESLVDALGPDAATVVGMDGFHLSNAVLLRHGSRGRKGAIDTFDADGYAGLIARLARARPGDEAIFAPAFDRDLDEPVAARIEVPARIPLVITEGNYLLADGAWSRARRHLAEVWYVDTAPDVRRRQLQARHRRFGESADEAARHAHGPDEVNARLVARTRHRADLLLAWAADPATTATAADPTR